MTGLIRLAAVGLALAVAAVSYAQGNPLDSSFDGDGRQTTDVAPGDDRVAGLEIDSSGRIVAAGVADEQPKPGTSRYIADIGVARYLPSGALDTSFAGDGTRVMDVAGDWDGASDVALQGDGRIVVAGGANTGSDYSYLAARLLADGSPDPSFSGDGLQTTDVATPPVSSSSSDIANAVAVAPNGAIVLAGGAGVDHGSGGQVRIEEDIGLVRYTADGDPDPTLSGDGIHTQDLPGETLESAAAVAVQPDGKIVVAGTLTEGAVGSSTRDGFVARFTAAGALDPAFSGDGWTRVDFGSDDEGFVDLVLLGDGRMLAAGSSGGTIGSGFAVARLTSPGELDPGFGSGGKVFVPPPGEDGAAYAWGLRVGAGGSIVVGGWAEALRFAAVRLSAAGAPVTSVTTANAPRSPNGSYMLTGGDVALQGDQRVVLGGGTFGEEGSFTGSEFSLVRFASLTPLPDPPGPGMQPESVPRGTFRARARGGVVRSRCAGQGWRRLRGTRELTTGCRVDVRRGRVRITSAANRDGSEVQSADFRAGMFRLEQRGSRRPVTRLVLDESMNICARGGRWLWGNGKGRFAIRGRRSLATARGTKWLVRDNCDGSTLTRVRLGRVEVRDFARRSTVTLTAGDRYIARR